MHGRTVILEAAMGDLSDIAYVLGLIVCLWIALKLSDDGDGGGRRARLRI